MRPEIVSRVELDESVDGKGSARARNQQRTRKRTAARNRRERRGAVVVSRRFSRGRTIDRDLGARGLRNQSKRRCGRKRSCVSKLWFHNLLESFTVVVPRAGAPLGECESRDWNGEWQFNDPGRRQGQWPGRAAILFAYADGRRARSRRTERTVVVNADSRVTGGSLAECGLVPIKVRVNGRDGCGQQRDRERRED